MRRENAGEIFFFAEGKTGLSGSFSNCCVEPEKHDFSPKMIKSDVQWNV